MFSTLRTFVASSRQLRVAGPSRSVPVAYTAVLCWCAHCERRHPQTVTGRCSHCLGDEIVTLGSTYFHAPGPIPPDAPPASVVAFPRGFAPLPPSVDRSGLDVAAEAGSSPEPEPEDGPTPEEVARELEHLEALARCRAAAGLPTVGLEPERAR